MYFEGISGISIHVALKPCPFCGRQAKLSGEYGNGKVTCWAVYCGTDAKDFSCGCQVTSMISEQAAIDAWNRRHDQKEGEA